MPNLNDKVTIYPNEINAIVVPNGALGGDAVLACMERNINIISVQNKGVLDVSKKWFEYENFFLVENYLEAAGFLLSMREGLNYKSVQRPLRSIKGNNFPN